jgi:hypothetical protein
METKGLLVGSTGLDRAAHVIPAVGIIDLLMSSAAWRGWSILRADASNNAPLSKRDSGEWLVMNIHRIMNDHPLVSWCL